MSQKELNNLQKNIDRLRDQINGARDSLITIEPSQKPRIKQQIEDLRAELREFEQEKWDLIAQMTRDVTISEDEAQSVVAEILAEGQEIMADITANPADQGSAEILGLLQKILDKLNEPGKPAAGKLKAAVSSLPPFVGLTYEAEIDTENTLRRYFPTITRWTREALDRLKK
jgi:septal ring factor EnvC (AmiA/AmiB activator)